MACKLQPHSRTLEKFERLHWLRMYFARSIRTSQERVGDGPLRTVDKSGYYDILHSEFVDDYLTATNVSFEPMFIGAHRCTTLSTDLRALYVEGTLRRYRAGIHDMGMGWPKWVWSYSVDPSAIQRLSHLVRSS